MALVAGRESTLTPSLKTNLGEQTRKLNEDRRSTKEVNEALVSSGTSFNATNQTIDKAGYTQAVDEYNHWLATKGDAVSNASSIKLDTSSGKITISAPQSVLNNAAVKENYGNIATELSKAYRADPNQKFALMKDSDEMKTVEEWVKDLDKSFKEEAPRIQQREDVKAAYKASADVDLSDEDVIKMYTVAVDYNDENGETVKVTKNTLQAIPLRLMELPVFKNLEGYDEEKHTVRWENLATVYNRDNVSDEDILELYDAVDKYFADGDFSDSTEYAEMTAMATFLRKKDPSVNFWRGTGEVLGQSIMGILSGAASFDVDVMSAFETFGNWAANVITSASGATDVESFKANWEESKKDDGTFIRDYLAPQLDEWRAERKDKLLKLNDAASAGYIITDTLTPMFMQIASSCAAGNAAAVQAQSLVGRVVTSIATKYGTTAAEMGTLTASAIASGAITAEEIVTGLYTGTEIMLTLTNSATASLAAMRAISAVKSATAVAGIVTKSADIAAQVIVDVTVSNPKLFRQLMESGDEESKAYAMEQLVQNVTGELVGAGIAKGVAGFSKTDVGRVLNARYATRINGLKASVGQTVDNLKINLFHGGNKSWLVEKATRLSEQAKKYQGTWLERIASNRASKAERQLQNYAERFVSRRAAMKVGEMAKDIKGDSWDELLESAKKVTNEMRKTVAEANVYLIQGMYNRDVSADLAKIVANNPKLGSARGSYLDALTTVLKAEKAEGLGKGLKIIDAGDGKKVRVLNKETNEYVNALYRGRIAQAEVDLSDVAENVEKARAEVERCNEIVKNFEKNHSEELVAAAKDLEKKGRSLQASVMDARVAEGVMAEDTLSGLRAAGIFEEGYLRQQRVDKWTAYKSNGGKMNARQLREIQKIDWGSSADWQDITLVLFDDMEELARQVVRKRQGETLKGLGLIENVVVNEDGTRVVEEANKSLRKKVKKDVQTRTDQFVKSMDGAFFNDFFQFKKSQTVVNKAQNQAVSSGGKVASAMQVKPRTSRVERRAFVMGLDDEGVNELIMTNQANPFLINLNAEGGYEAFEEGLGRNARQWLRDKMQSQVGYLYDAPVSDYNRAITNINQMEKYSASSWKAATGEKVPSWAKSFVTDKGGKEISDLTEIDELKKLWESTKKASKVTPSIYNAENFNRLIANDPSALSELKRIYAASDASTVNSSSVADAVAAIKQEKRIFEAKTVYAERLQRLKELKDKYNLPGTEKEVIDSINEMIDDAIDVNGNDPELMKALNALGDANAGGEDILEYVTTKSLVENKGNIKKSFRAAAKDRYNQQITADINLKYANDPKGKKEALARVNEISKRYAKESADLMEDVLIQRYEEITGRLAAQGSDIIDKNDYFARVTALNKQITDAAADPNVVKIYGAHGYEEYVEVSPTVASMFTNVPRPIRQGPFGAIQNAFVRTFRFGTTGGIIPGSLINQAFRDTGNALVSGAAWKSSRQVRNILANQFGDTLADYMQKEMPDVWETLVAESDETGKPIEELLARRELEIGSMGVETQLEKNIYQLGRESRAQMKAEGKYERNIMQRAQDSLDKWQERLEIPNTIREKYLRNRVYSNNLLNALEDGMSLPEARTFAQFMQQEATTNFTRQSYHLANLSQTVPYLSAAINGQKSFWRLYSIDPVGVTTRIVGGYVVPIIALTTNSLKDEEDRRIYKQLNEYDKKGTLTFVLSGQIISIPIPNEISNFVAPVQNMVEKMYNANDNSFAELMANDLLGSFPVDLSGFINIDADRILEENLASDHLLPGFSKIASSLMPPLVKSGFMLATGIDPYTGRKISKTDYTIDEETGERLIMDSKSGALARSIGSKLGDYISAAMAQKVLQNIFGKGGMTIIDSIGDVVDAVNDDEMEVSTGFSNAAQRLVESGTEKFYVERYGEESNLAWQRAVNVLEGRKEELLNDKKYLEDLDALSSNTLSEKAKKEVESRVRTREQEYMQQVLDATNNLIKNYGGTFDRKKLLTVISLMNLGDDEINKNPYNKYSTYLNNEDYKLNRAVAVETMMNMGFRSATDSSLFGYYYNDPNTGEVTVKYNSPLAILNYDYTSQQQKNLDEVEVDNTLKEKNLTRFYMFGDEYKAAKAAGKKALKKYKADWNKKIVEALAPYIQERGVDAFLNSSHNRAILGGEDGYLFIDNKYKVREYLKSIFEEKE